MGNPVVDKMKQSQTKLLVFGILGIALVAAAIFLFTPGMNPSQEKDRVKIGVVIPLTKDYAFLGEPIRNAILLAHTELGNMTKYDYMLIFEDSQLNPTVALAAAQKLVNVDQVDAIISFNSGVGNIISPMAEENGIIHTGIASDAVVAEGDYNFIHWTPPSEESKFFVEELQKRGIEKVAVIGVSEGGGKVILDAVKDRIEGTNISIVSEELSISDETDFKTVILKAEQETPDIYLILVGTNRLELIAKQMREMGIDTPLTSIENFEFTDNPELFEGMWYIQAAESSVEFSNKYETEYGERPNVGAPNAYDNFNLIVRAFEAAGETSYEKPSNREVLSELMSVSGVEGALGTLSMSDEGIVLSNATVKEIIDGQLIIIRR